MGGERHWIRICRRTHAQCWLNSAERGDTDQGETALSVEWQTGVHEWERWIESRGGKFWGRKGTGKKVLQEHLELRMRD